MTREFRLPDIGEGLTEAEIVSWLVAEGEHVDADQPIVEVETDKAVVEIPSPFAGVVVRHGGIEGDVIAVGSVLVVIGEQSGAPIIEESSFVPPEQPPVEQSAPIVGTLDEEEVLIVSAPDAATATPQGVKALPLVRKMARDAGVDIETVAGTGPGGRITREDVERALPASTPTQVVAEAVEPSAAVDTDQRIPMTRLRRTIAGNMSKSWAEIPHVTTFDDIDATRLLDVRSALGDRHETRIPLEALVVRAVLPALVAFPEFNATVDEDDLIVHGSHDIGIAVDTPEGLMVAVIDDADSKGVLQLAEEIRRLGDGARERTLSLDELTGQTFTVSNIGAVGGGHGTPIVPYGTTAILSIGRAQSKPIVYEGDLAIAPVMPLSISYDHRVVDGGQGRRFMAMVIENLEEPALFLAG